MILRFNSSPYTNTVTVTLLFAASICQENYWGNVLMRETEIVTVLDFVVYVYVYIYISSQRDACILVFPSQNAGNKSEPHTVAFFAFFMLPS